MDNTNKQDVVAIRFIKWEGKVNTGKGIHYAIPLCNTTREEALQLRSIISRDPCIGFIDIHLTNNNVL